MYRKEPSIPLRSSSAALYNNLSVLRPPGRPLACLGAVYGPGLSLVTVAADGLGFSHRQLQAKEGGTALSTSLLTQVRGPCARAPCWASSAGGAAGGTAARGDRWVQQGAGPGSTV